MGQNRLQTDCCQDDCASPLSFISQTKLHDLETRDQFIGFKFMPEEIRNIFYSATDDVIRIMGGIFVDIESKGFVAKIAEFFFITEGSKGY